MSVFYRQLKEYLAKLDADLTTTGDVSAADGTFTGDVTAVNGDFSGNIEAVDATLTGDLILPAEVDWSGSVTFGASGGGYSHNTTNHYYYKRISKDLLYIDARWSGVPLTGTANYLTFTIPFTATLTTSFSGASYRINSGAYDAPPSCWCSTSSATVRVYTRDLSAWPQESGGGVHEIRISGTILVNGT